MAALRSVVLVTPRILQVANSGWGGSGDLMQMVKFTPE